MTVGKTTSTSMSVTRKSARDRQAATYIADMLLELRNIAKAEELTQLQQYLELSYYEAFSAASRVPIPEEELRRLEEIGMDAKRATVT
jgi:hypothetical protein